MGRLPIVSTMVVFLAPAIPVAAQESPATANDATAIQDIVVTARRVEESLQKTPIAVSAFDEQALERSAVANVVDLDLLTPNLLSSEGAGGGSGVQYFIRGVGQSDFIAALEPAVGSYLDGVYLGRTVGAALDLASVERVEVLRGPQGTLFGRNTIGGAVNVVSKRPTKDFGGSVDLTGGSRNNFTQRLSVNTPLGDRLAGKLDVAHIDQDGWGRRLLDGGRMSDKNRLAARGALLWEPTDDSSVYITADYTRDHGTADYHYLAAVAPGIPTAILDPQYIPTVPYTTYAGIPTPNRLNVRGVSADAQIPLGNWRLRSLLSFRSLDSFTAVDFDGSPLQTADQQAITDQEQWSGELQLTRTFDNKASLLFGLYHFDESVSQLIPVTLLGSHIRQGNELENDSSAFFAQVNYPLTEQLDLSLGGRITKEKKRHTFDDALDIGGTLIPLFPLTTVEDEWSPFTWRATLDFDLTDDLLLYASYATGFRSGGFNARPVGINEISSFDPEKLGSVEAGLKSQWFDHRLRVNLAAFFNKYDDIQTTTLQGVTILTANSAQAEVKGFEAEIIARIAAPLEVFLSVGNLDTKYTDIGAGAITLQPSFDLAGSPDWTVSAGGQWTIALQDRGSVVLSANYRYTSAFFFWPTNLPFDRQGAYDVTNVRASYISPNDKWELTAYGLNVFDERYASFAIDGSGFLGHSTRWDAAPDEWGVQLKYRF